MLLRSVIDCGQIVTFAMIIGDLLLKLHQ